MVIGFSVCAEEDKAYYVILAKWIVDRLEPAYLRSYKQSIPLLELLKTKKLIMHNSVFDCRIVQDYFKIDLMPSVHTDTKILAHLLNENQSNGLKELASIMFGEDSKTEQLEMKVSVIANGGKLTRDCYELYKADPYLIGKYGAKDALLTYKLFIHLVPTLYEEGLDTFFYEEESMPLLKGPTYELNTTGLSVNRDTLTNLKKTLEAECLEAKDFIRTEIEHHVKDKYPGTNKKNHFNIGSNQQLSWLLFSKLELEFGTLTEAGKNVCKALGLRIPYTANAKRDFISICTNSTGSTLSPAGLVNGKKVNPKKIKEPWCYIAVDKKTLAKLAPKRKWIAKLLEYQRKNKILNTYVNGIEERIQYGIISPQFLQHGTTSGRYASRTPNFQNLPRDDKRIKSCIQSRPGKSFVGADYSQLEPRVFAYFSKDKRLLEAFKGEDDFYSVIGMEVYDKFDCIPRKDGSPEAFGVKYKHLRDLSKIIALATTYGATAYKLAPITGKSTEDTQADIDSYFEKFPGVAEMMNEAHELAKTKGKVTNLFGRPRRMPEAVKFTKLYGNVPTTELPYEARNLLNLSVNHRIQSTAASIVNRAAIRFNNNCIAAGLDCRLVLQVHDSLIAECPDDQVEWVAALLQDAMENTVELEGIRLEAVPKIGKNLSEV
jgi:DNA polymerase I-like protein with 3'-5' exonuclease and polymerase domains